MQINLKIHFRRFNSSENRDSGYYNSLTDKKTCRIDVNLEDDPFEQLLTVFHEITHFLFDLYSRYEFDNKHQKVNKRSPELREEWRKYNRKIEKLRRDGQREELICRKVERAVRVILLSKIPKQFLAKLFTDNKKKSIIKKKRKGKK